MSLFERLKSSAADDWNAYIDHAFVRGLGDGSLPEAAFRNYLVQDYLFLIQFARAHALAAYKSRTLADMQAARGGLGAILDEMKLHLRVCERWGLSAADVEATQEQQATVAYTRFVLDTGMSGDLLDLQVALVPCTLGYAEIGRRLAPDGIDAIPADHPYRDWIAEYSGQPFQQAGAGLVHVGQGPALVRGQGVGAGELDQEQVVLHQVVAEGGLGQAAVAEPAHEGVVDVGVPVVGGGGLEAFEQGHGRSPGGAARPLGAAIVGHWRGRSQRDIRTGSGCMKPRAGAGIIRA